MIGIRIVRHTFDNLAAARFMLVYGWLEIYVFPLYIRQRTYVILCASDTPQ